MSHPDWPAFLSAIVAEPDEDTPRLVAADFLDENGESDRAAFIRVQVALTRLEASGLSKSAEANVLRKKERAFLGPKSVYRHLWAAAECPELVRIPTAGRTGSPLAHLHVEGVERLTWRRGFVEFVRCSASEWLRHGTAVRTRNPVWNLSLSDYLVARDVWYTGFTALRGLRQINLYGEAHSPPVERDAVMELVSWLRQWLPDTRVAAWPDI